MNKFLVRVIDPILGWLSKDRKNAGLALIGVIVGLFFFPVITIIVLGIFIFGVWRIMNR